MDSSKDRILAMGSQIHIVGPLKLQNELLAFFLQEATGTTCVCSKDVSLVASTMKKKQNTLILWDCRGADLSNLWTDLDTYSESKRRKCFFALFNAGMDGEKSQTFREAINRGVRGIFFEDDSPEILSKGVQAILKGEIWLSRKFLSKCLREKFIERGRPQEAPLTPLTQREKEIILMIPTGASNDEIADQLNISPHTVKTHLYNIYGKINVPNRTHAALWAAKNL